jgi:hypothetical protein
MQVEQKCASVVSVLNQIAQKQFHMQNKYSYLPVHMEVMLKEDNEEE